MTTRHIQSAFRFLTVDELVIGDEASLRHVALYPDLKEVLRRARYPFRVLPKGQTARADRALLLNLTYWSPDAGGDVLVDEHIDADVVAHAAWHHLAARATNSRGAPSVDALFLGEAIASAFDVYLVGRLLGHAPASTFLESQVPAMADAASAAGLSERGFERLLGEIARNPERAFADLRELLFDASRALFASKTAEAGYAALASFERHRFGALLHRYEISNWVLYARAYGARSTNNAKAAAVDLALRRAPVALDWLATNWIAPLLIASAPPGTHRGRPRPRSA